MILRTLAAACVALALLAPAAHATPTATNPSAADELVGAERVVVSSGHVDLGLRQIDGAWTLMARDDTVSPPVWRRSTDVVLQVGDAALANVPTGDDYSFLGVGSGEKVHVIPQTENPGVVWLGWNTQAPETIAAFPRGADLVLTSHTGPGALHLFIANGFDARAGAVGFHQGPGAEGSHGAEHPRARQLDLHRPRRASSRGGGAGDRCRWVGCERRDHTAVRRGQRLP